MDLEALGWNPEVARQFAELPQGTLQPGRIARVHRLHFFAMTRAGELLARLPGRSRVAGDQLPVVGDWVALERGAGRRRAVIRAVLPRRSKFSRKVPGKEIREQVIVANVDCAFLVNGLDVDFSPRRIERYLALCATSGVMPVVVLNKTDTCADVPRFVRAATDCASGAPVCAISALHRQGLEALEPHLGRGCTVALLGSSGVGKSTLVNALLDCERMTVAPVRSRDGRGKHVTTRRELLVLPGRSALIDTPGLRELQLWGDRQMLDEAFPEITAIAGDCRFGDCAHDAEPGCAVRGAVERGALEAERLLSFHKLHGELEALAQRQRAKARRSKGRPPSRRGG